MKTDARSLSITGLIPNPTGCPINATEELGSEFSKNLECFLGFSSDVTDKPVDSWNFFYLFTSWVDVDDTTTTSSTSHYHTINTTTSTATTTTKSDTTISTEAPIEKTTIKTPASNKDLVIIIVSSVVGILLIVVGLVITCYNKKKTLAQNSLITILMKRQEISDKDAKVLAATVDKFELNSKQVSIDFNEKIGSGSTSTVYKGQKELNHCETEQIMQELQAMRRIGYHSHISVLLGWCFHNDLPTLVMELAHQDLYTYVYSFRNTENTSLSLTEFLSIAWQISNGMEHVASYQIIHRDLASRNILMFDGLHVKISDFGLSCNCDETFAYEATLKKRLPIRWLSIEALIDKRFTEKSDVWAFGVLLYEMCTNGAVPYSLMSNHEIIEFLQSGSRLEKPENIAENDEIYEIMLECWRECVEDRPPFSQISVRLENLMEGATRHYGYLSVVND